MITPAYPAMNSSLSVSRQTLQILHEEICRGYNIVDAIWKKSKTSNNIDEVSSMFHELFSPSDFFISFPYYLSMCIVASNQHDSQIWAGFVESRLRKLASDMLGKSLPLSKIQLWSKSISICCADPSSLITANQRKNCITFFIGFQVDTLRMRGNELNLEQQLQYFKDNDLSRFSGFVSGMDIYLRYYKVNSLPRIVFEGMYSGGKDEAMRKKKHLRESDPKWIEAKRKSKLAQLKAKMEKLQSKAQEKLQDAAAIVASEQEEEQPATDISNDIPGNDDTTITVNDDEAMLLEDVLDNIQQSDVGISSKTRQEAELDRKKLLAGELLVEGGGVDDDDNYDDNINSQSIMDLNADGSNMEMHEQGSQQELTKENQQNKADDVKSKSRMDSVLQPELKALRDAGYTFISSDDEEDSSSDSDITKPEPIISFSAYNYSSILPTTKKYKRSNCNPPSQKKYRQSPKILGICFNQKFDVVELDDAGNVIDKGDDDYMPSKKWNGRRGGFGE